MEKEPIDFAVNWLARIETLQSQAAGHDNAALDALLAEAQEGAKKNVETGKWWEYDTYDAYVEALKMMQGIPSKSWVPRAREIRAEMGLPEKPDVLLYGNGAKE